jgi:hypothetical protein
LVVLAASGRVFAQEHGHGGGGFAGHMVPEPVGFDRGALPHQHIDARFSHNYYYFDRGYTVHEAPIGGLAVDHGHDHYWYDRGDWYRRDGLGWMVVGAPLGALVSALPAFYTTVWLAGVPYYYANDTYYAWNSDQQGYEVVAPPAGIESEGTTQEP